MTLSLPPVKPDKITSAVRKALAGIWRTRGSWLNAYRYRHLSGASLSAPTPWGRAPALSQPPSPASIERERTCSPCRGGTDPSHRSVRLAYHVKGEVLLAERRYGQQLGFAVGLYLLRARATVVTQLPVRRTVASVRLGVACAVVWVVTAPVSSGPRPPPRAAWMDAGVPEQFLGQAYEMTERAKRVSNPP
eukprot:scaffold2119_cov355-Prasinococcus_capsulatus_cf.AAC.14